MLSGTHPVLEECVDINVSHIVCKGASAYIETNIQKLYICDGMFMACLAALVAWLQCNSPNRTHGLSTLAVWNYRAVDG